MDIPTRPRRLVSAEERLRIACHTSGIGVWEWETATGQMNYCGLARGICGFSADEPITIEKARSVTHPDDLPLTWALAARALDPSVRDCPVFRYRIVRADTSEVRWVQAYGEAIFEDGEDGPRATHYIGIIQDITGQKEAEDALAESEARLRLAIDTGQMAVWELDMDTQVVTPSPELNRLYGFADDATPSIHDYRSRYAPGEQARLQAEGAAAAARGETKFQTEFKHVWPDGTEKWLLLRAQLSPTTRQPNRVLGVVIDVTESKRQEVRLEAQARELRHRLLNAVTVISAIASSTFRNTQDYRSSLADFQGRISAIGAATQLMFSQTGESFQLAELVRLVTAPFRDQHAEAFDVTGDDVEVPGSLAGPLAMALHELCTNALKYGALSAPEGRVKVTWTCDPTGALALNWIETDGPPVRSPGGVGFGTTLLQKMLFHAPDRVDVTYDESGIRCRVQLDVSRGVTKPAAQVG